MSRIGKMPVTLPAGVSVEMKDDVLTVKGAKGTLTQQIVGAIDVKTEGNVAHVVTLNEEPETQASRSTAPLRRKSPFRASTRRWWARSRPISARSASPNLITDTAFAIRART